MATTKTSKTKTTKTAAKVKATPKAKKPTVAKSAAPATATMPSPTNALVQLVIDTYPETPKAETMLEQLAKRGIHASMATAKTVREQARRVLKVLADSGRFTAKK